MSPFTPLPRDLETARLRLRPLSSSDSDAVRALWTERDPRSLRVIDSDGKPTVDDIRAGLEEQSAETARTGIALLAIERRSDGEFVGYSGLVVGRATLDEPELAYELPRLEHGKGYATEAAGAVLDAARATGRTRLWATVREWNAASFRVLDKLGFEESGRRTADPERGDTIWMTRSLSD